MDDDKEIEEKDLAATCPNDDGGWNLPCDLLFAGPVTRIADPPQCFYINEWLAT